METGSAQTTGLDRVKAAFRGEKTDRVAFYPIVSGLVSRLVGVRPGDYYRGFGKLADSHLAFYEAFRPDVVVLMADLFMEVEGMGATVEFPDDDVPRLRSYLLEEKSALSSLRLPDPAADGRMPRYVEACRKTVAAVRESAVGGVVCGPFTIAANLRGAENLIIDTKTDPPFVHELMRFAAEVPKRMGLEVARAGVGLSLSDAPASISLISPSIYREFVLPYQRDVISYLRDNRIGATLHICGFTDPIMDDIVSTGAAAVSMDKPSSLARMFEASRGKTVVIGNVSTGVFVDGTRDDVEGEIVRCLGVGKDRPNYILSTGCEISPRGDMERVGWFFDKAREVCRHQ